MTEIRIEKVLVGGLKPLEPARGGEEYRSGIFKSPVDCLEIASKGIVGDAQGDLRVHGGTIKAVHHYPLEHYPRWREETPEMAPDLDDAGAFGENLSTFGLTEDGVCIGDSWRIGTALLQITQGRQPCWRLNLRFGRDDVSRRMLESGRTGWYYRIIQPGRVRPGDAMELLERPNPDWTVALVYRLLHHEGGKPEQFARLAAMEELSPSWRAKAEKRGQSQGR